MLQSLTASCGMPSVKASSASTGCSPAGGAPRIPPRRARPSRPPAGRAQVGADDPPAGAAARQRRQVDPLRLGQPARERRCLDRDRRCRPSARRSRSWWGSRCLAATLGWRRGLDLRLFFLRRRSGLGLRRGQQRRLTSSPSPAKIAIGVPTFTPSEPSGTRILAILPSSTASNSIVALSVSISARMSPDDDRVAFLDQPFGERPLLHRRRQGGHLQFDGHGTLGLGQSRPAQRPKR